MQFRPHITLLFILSVFTILTVFSIVIPQDGIQLGKGLKISFFQLTQLFEKTEEYADISNIVAEYNISIDSINSDTDSLQHIDIVTFDTVRANADSLKKSIRKIEFPAGQRQLLFQAFQAMDSAKKRQQVVRVMHYGDSQIEGDRITSLVRNRLQNKFGGKGIGLVPARQLYAYGFSAKHTASENWNRYTIYGNRDTLITHGRYGILASFCSFTRQPIDTSSIDTSKKHSAWISLSKSYYSYKNTKDFDQLRLFYGYNNQPFSAKLFMNDTLQDEGIYPKSDELKEIKWLFTEPGDNVFVEFEGCHSPEIYGLAFDGKGGVAVDNIAMRGSAGLVFTRMNPVLFKQMVARLNVEVMILEFGGNIVPNIRKSYKYYENWFGSQLKYIKKHAPHVKIIVIGVADMSMKKNNRYVSYPNIELVRNAMKKTAFDNGAAYWDMYEAMGGKNSMPSWVFATPSLAAKDFVHFNPRGARIIANMFYNALLYEYNYYKRNTQ